MEKRIKKGLLLFALAAEVVFVSIPVPVMAKEEVYLEIVDAELWDEDTSLLLQENSEEGTVISEEGMQISPEDFLKCEEKTVASSESGRRCEIRVALIDTGVDTTSALVQGHIADGYDASNMSDENGHGTLMAEIIASNTNENVKIVPYKVFDENGRATVGAIYDALLKAINEKVDVISLSVSGYGTSNMLTSAIAKAKEKGIYVVVAAGNNSDHADKYMPGNISDAITVSGVSVDETGTKTLAAYSNYGSVVDYSAFGTIVKDYGTEDAADDEVYEGTSVSAANVSSYIATMLQYVRDDGATDYDEVLDALNSTTEDLGEGGRDDAFGVGYLSFEEIQKYISDKNLLEESEESDSRANQTENLESEVKEVDDNEAEGKEAVDEEIYPGEEGDIDFDFEKEDVEQELETSGTYTAEGQYAGLSLIAAQNDLNGGKNADIYVKANLPCAANYRITIPAGRKLRFFNSTNTSYTISNIDFVVYGELNIYTKGNGNLTFIGNSGNGKDAATISIEKGGKSYIKRDGGSGSIVVAGGTNGIAVHDGGTLESPSALLCSLNYGNGLFNAGSASVSGGNFSSNGTDRQSNSHIVFPNGASSQDTYAFAGISNHGYLTATSCTVSSNKNNGIRTQAGTTTILNGSTVSSNNSNGISSAGTFTVNTCDIYSNKNNGFVAAGSASTTISNSSVYSNGGDGIQNGDNTSKKSSMNISGTTVRNNSSNGVYNYAGSSLVIDSGNYYDNGSRQVLNESATGIFNLGLIINNGNFFSSGLSRDGIKNDKGGTTCIQGATNLSALSGKIALYNPSGAVYLQGNAKITGSGIGINNKGTLYVRDTENISGSNAIYNTGNATVYSGVFHGSSDALYNKGSMTIESATVNGATRGVYNAGTIVQASGTITGNIWGIYNSGTYTQNGGKVFGSSTNSSGKSGGVFQNGTYNISGTAQVASGDVYLCSGKMINVSGELTGTSKVAAIDSADKDAGKVLVQNSYQNGPTAQSTCENYVKGSNPKFKLSSNLPKAKTSSADTSEVEATYSSENAYHDAVLRAGQGLQNTTSETNNPEIMNKEFSNGAEGTLVLSCYLDVTYDLSKVEEITGLRARTYAANGIVDNNYNRNIWKEGFTTSDSEFNNYSNNNDYEVKLSSSNIELDTTHGSSNNLSDIISEVNDGADIIDLLVAGKTYSSGNSKATEGADSYTFLGWCLQEDGSGYIYSSPTSFPIGNNYKWYPIFDVAYSVEYNSNYATPNRSDLGGEMHYNFYDNGSSVERTTLSIATKDMTSIVEDTFFKVSSKDETTHLYATSEVLGNCGPNLDTPNYWDKEIETTHKNIYTELDDDYTYWYKFIGWSLNQNSNFTDVFNSDYTRKVYTTSDVENFISPKISYVENNSVVNNADRLSRLKFLENHSDFIKVKEVDNQSLLYVTMYAIWDEYPEIFAKDFTLMSNDAALTNADTFKQAVIDNYITATDYELNYKSDEHLIVTVENLDYDAIKSIGHGGDDVGTVSVTVKVVDEVGNASYDTCDVTIISSTGMTSPSDGENASLYVRFIDEENWLKNDFWNIIFANGTKSIKDFGDTESQQIAKMEQICDAYELWLSQTGLSLEVERILEGTISVEAMNALRNLDASKTNIQRTMENNSNDGAMDPYSKWYLNPQLVLEINESFDGIVSNPQ